jgi:hypothetical protein
MSLFGHIVSSHNRTTRDEAMFDVIMKNLWLIMPALWGCFVTYGVWYFARAKRYSSISAAEARQLWAIHKNGVRCGRKRWRKIERGGRIVGFECECGFRHVQRRPLVARAPAAVVRSEVSAFDRLQTSHK